MLFHSIQIFRSCLDSTCGVSSRHVINTLWAYNPPIAFLFVNLSVICKSFPVCGHCLVHVPLFRVLFPPPEHGPFTWCLTLFCLKVRFSALVFSLLSASVSGSLAFVCVSSVKL